jgi:hypothetical protein
MRTRLALGGLAATLALGAVAPAQAAPQRRCVEELALVCAVVCLATKACP